MGPHGGISALLRRDTRERALSPLVYIRKKPYGHSKMLVRKSSLTGNQICQHLDLILPTSKRVRNVYCLSHSVHGICYSSLNKRIQASKSDRSSNPDSTLLAA